MLQYSSNSDTRPLGGDLILVLPVYNFVFTNLLSFSLNLSSIYPSIKVEKYKGVRHTSILEKTIDDVTPRLPVENLFQIQANQKSNYQVNLPKVQLQEKDFDLKIHSSLRTKLMSVGVVDSALNVSAPGMNETEKGSVEDVSPSRKSNQADSVR